MIYGNPAQLATLIPGQASWVALLNENWRRLEANLGFRFSGDPSVGISAGQIVAFDVAGQLAPVWDDAGAGVLRVPVGFYTGLLTTGGQLIIQTGGLVPSVSSNHSGAWPTSQLGYASSNASHKGKVSNVPGPGRFICGVYLESPKFWFFRKTLALG